MFDQRVFSAAAVSERTRAVNREVSALRADIMTVPGSVEEMRARIDDMIGRVNPVGVYRSPLATTREIDGPAGRIELRVFVPDDPQAILIFNHGGGWSIGAPDVQDLRLEYLAKMGVVVVAPRYRLAPENPYPAGAEDCEAAARWVLRNGAREFGAERIVLGGESAGANLAAVTAVRLRDRPNGIAPPAGYALVYGSYDLSMTPSQRRFGDPTGSMGTTLLGWFYDQYATPERRRDPEISPLYADLAGLGPAIFVVGTEDPLLDDSLFMHARWIAAGNPSEIVVAPGGLHGFNGYPLDIAEQANLAVGRFVLGS